MADTTIQPALTDTEWAYFTSGGIQKHVIQYAIEAAELDRAHDLSSHALAALALYGQPFGFTREDVEVLAGAIERISHEGAPGADSFYRPRLESLAARLAALLPRG